MTITGKQVLALNGRVVDEFTKGFWSRLVFSAS